MAARLSRTGGTDTKPVWLGITVDDALAKGQWTGSTYATTGYNGTICNPTPSGNDFYFYIGSRQAGYASPNYGLPFRNILVFDKALTDDEILSIMRALKAPVTGQAYGILYDPSIAAAVNACQKVVLQGGEVSIVSDFDALPAHHFRRCVMDNLATGHINYYLDEQDSTKKADGTAADLTGADGDVMVEIPVVYWRVDDQREDGKVLYLVSDHPFEGSEIHPYFYVSPGGATPQTQYVGAFHAILCDSSGEAYVTDITATANHTYATGDTVRSVAGAKPLG